MASCVGCSGGDVCGQCVVLDCSGLSTVWHNRLTFNTVQLERMQMNKLEAFKSAVDKENALNFKQRQKMKKWQPDGDGGDSYETSGVYLRVCAGLREGESVGQNQLRNVWFVIGNGFTDDVATAAVETTEMC